MKKRGVFWISPSIWILILLSALLIVPSFYLSSNWYLPVAETVVWLAVSLAAVSRMSRLKKDVSRYLERIAGTLDHGSRGTLESFPQPAVAFSSTGEILWYNGDFLNTVLNVWEHRSQLTTG